jgi:SnoaL-like domain
MHVVLDGGQSDGQPPGDFLVRQPLANKVRNLQFTCRKPGQAQGWAVGDWAQNHEWLAQLARRPEVDRYASLLTKARRKLEQLGTWHAPGAGALHRADHPPDSAQESRIQGWIAVAHEGLIIERSERYVSTPIESTDRQLVERYFKSMQAGAEGLEEMVSLFSDDGEYIEPFSAGGRPSAHRGAAAIRAFFQESFAGPLGHDVRLTLERLDVDAGRLRSEWTCEMPMFPRPLRGYDLYTLEGGKIKRLEVNVTDMPPMPSPPGS